MDLCRLTKDAQEMKDNFNELNFELNIDRTYYEEHDEVGEDGVQNIINFSLSGCPQSLGNSGCDGLKSFEESALPLLEKYNHDFYKNFSTYSDYKKQCLFFDVSQEPSMNAEAFSQPLRNCSDQHFGYQFSEAQFNNSRQDTLEHFAGGESDVTSHLSVNEFSNPTFLSLDKDQYFPPNQLQDTKNTTVSASTQLSNHGERNQSKKSDHIRRPMNAFMVWSRLERKKLAKCMPHVRNPDLSKILGDRWKNMSNQERIPFIKEAERIKVLHSATFPEYKYKPKKRKSKANIRKVSNDTINEDGAADVDKPASPTSTPSIVGNSQEIKDFDFKTEIDSFLKSLEDYDNLASNENIGTLGDDLLEAIEAEECEISQNLTITNETHNLASLPEKPEIIVSFSSDPGQNEQKCKTATTNFENLKNLLHSPSRDRRFTRFPSYENYFKFTNCDSPQKQNFCSSSNFYNELHTQQTDKDNLTRTDMTYPKFPHSPSSRNLPQRSCGSKQQGVPGIPCCSPSNAFISPHFRLANEQWSFSNLFGRQYVKNFPSEVFEDKEQERNLTLKDLVKCNRLVSREGNVPISPCIDKSAIDDWVHFLKDIPVYSAPNCESGSGVSIPEYLTTDENLAASHEDSVHDHSAYKCQVQTPSSEIESNLRSLIDVKSDDEVSKNSKFGNNISRSVSKDSGVDGSTNYSSASSRRSSLDSLDSILIDEPSDHLLQQKVESTTKDHQIEQDKNNEVSEPKKHYSSDAFLTDYSMFDYSSCPYYTPSNCTTSSDNEAPH